MTGGPATVFAIRYQETLVPVIFRPWAREMIRRAAPQDGEDVLDLACGTGAVTMELAAQGMSPGSVTGVDISPGMLAVAAENAKEAGIDATWIEADATALPLPDDAFDVAFCQQALQFFPDRVAALKDLRRVLRPGSRAAFCVQRELSLNPLLRAQSATLDRHVGVAAGDAVRAICSLGDQDEIGANFEEAGFTIQTLDTVSLPLNHPDGRAFAAGALGGMHTGDKLAEATEEERQACYDDFLAALGDCFDGTGISFPHVSTVILANVPR